MKVFLSLMMAAIVLAYSTNANAAIVLIDNFDSYTDGNLSGQGGWTATAAAATPMQISGGIDKVVSIGTSGQDEYKAFTAPYTIVDGDSIKSTFQIVVSSAGATGDYFYHLSNPAGTSTNFFGRVFARSSGAGFQLGLLATSGTGSSTNWGTDVLNFNQAYNLDLLWNFVAGPTNDTFVLNVDNAAYVTHTWNSATAEPTALAAANLRQGSAANAVALTFNNLQVETIAAIPEPSTIALSTLAGLGFLGYRLRRK